MILCAGALASRAEFPVQVGDSDAHMRARLGSPTRVIDTDDGQLYFFGPTLIFVTQGAIDFISVSYGLPQDLPSAPPPISAPPPTPPGRPRNLAPARIEAPVWDAALTDAERALSERAERQQRIASRTRRFSMSKSYVSLSRDFNRALPLALADTGIGFKDARGHALPAFGDNTWSTWYSVGIDIRDFILAE
ncbi:MAG: hypothetical protein K8T26_15755 [Lentisphaerae bacterium]|nr:hypothetical protein [Lentisphaerota bacterium]